MAMAVTSFAQGEFQFQNNTAQNPVTYGATTAGLGFTPGTRVFGAAAGTWDYGVFVGASSATSFSQLTLFDTTLSLASANSSSGLAGLISGGAAGITGSTSGNPITGNGNAGSPITLVAGTTYVVEVVAWTHADGNTLAAVLASADPAAMAGSSGLGSVTATTTPTPIAQLFGTSAGQLGGFSVNTIPEPTTIALGGLGAAALMFFRRRK